MNTANIILIVALFGIFVLGVWVIPQWRFRRAVKQVLDTFHRNSATRPENARTLEDLGLNIHRTFVQTLMRGRDYRGYALAAMLKAQVVIQTDEGKLYLVEEKVPPAFRSPA